MPGDGQLFLFHQTLEELGCIRSEAFLQSMAEEGMTAGWTQELKDSLEEAGDKIVGKMDETEEVSDTQEEVLVWENDTEKNEDSEEETVKKPLVEEIKKQNPPEDVLVDVKEGGWSWIVMVAGILCVTILSGIAFSFGVVLEPLYELVSQSVATLVVKMSQQIKVIVEEVGSIMSLQLSPESIPFKPVDENVKSKVCVEDTCLWENTSDGKLQRTVAMVGGVQEGPVGTLHPKTP